jgi:hypothetical protein
MVDYIETFSFNVHMNDGFDCDDVRVELRNLVEDFGLVVNSIFIPSQPSASKSVGMPNDLDEKIEIAWEVLKGQLIVNKKNMGPSLYVVFSITFFCGE